ncbi:flagellar hook-length control protein FliK [Limnohabitans sp.]|uniref:flagellar hook-length control protein FliK n=1 Tax=Limnohabitans sp. TaxID=1907725 RepID=UPI00286EF650|nr:flagellar hook-length control protein FliK [Limnohabitans sp.]
MAILGPEGVHAITRVAPVHMDMRVAYVEAPVARQLGLHDGQVVQATAKVVSQQLKLVLNEHAFNVPLFPYIKEGDIAQLRAQLLPTGKWALQLLHTGNFAGPEAVPTGMPTRLNTLLFQPPGFANLLALLRPGVLEGLVPPVIEAGELKKRIQGQRLNMGSLQPLALKRFILGHTKTSEASLADGEPVVDSTKVLLRLLMAERERVEDQDSVDTQDSLKHALDELEAAQVQSSQTVNKGDLQFGLVIPFRDADPVELHFEQKGNKPGQPKNPLVVNMHTDSRVLGEVWLKTTISHNAQVDLTMWALRKDVADLAKFNAPDLTDELEGAGLHMGSFQVYNAPRPEQQEAHPPPEHGSLIDTRV